MKRGMGSEKGAALVLCLVIMMMLSMLTVSVLTQATGKINTTDAQLVEAELLQVAETGLDGAILEMNAQNDDAVDPLSSPSSDGLLGLPGWTVGGCDTIQRGGDPDRMFNGVPNFDEPGVVPLTYREIEYYTWAQYFCNDGIDNDANGLMDTVDSAGVALDPDVDSPDPGEVRFVRLLVFARRNVGPAARRRETVYEAILRSQGSVQEHAFFYFPFAIGSCNQLDIPFELAFGGQTGAGVWVCGNCGYVSAAHRTMCPQCWQQNTFSKLDDGSSIHSDYIVGDIFHDGDMKWTQGARADGNVTATGKITGNPGQDATVSEYADPIEAPSLADMDYRNLADYVVDGSTPLITKSVNTGYSSSVDTPPESDPRHIFVENYRDDLGVLAENAEDNGTGDAIDQWMFADAWEGNYLGNISLHPTDGTDKVYYVDGDLWLETGAYHSMFVDDPAEGSRITVVVEGNIYVCDDFWVVQGSSSSSATAPALTDDCENGIAFLAITGGKETFTDMNGNWEWDPGEPILNDDGDGVYEGPKYGCGNITYGDPNTGPVGHSQAFFYAENNFKDYCLDGDGQPLDIGITGLMSAGGLLDINRDFGNKHAQMTSITDTRLHDKLISLPGLPRDSVAGSQYPTGPYKVVSWRRLR